MAEKCGYQLVQRKAAPEDFQDAMLVVLATNDPRANEELARSFPRTGCFATRSKRRTETSFFPLSSAGEN